MITDFFKQMSIRTGQQVIILVEISSHRAPQVDPSPSSHSCPKAIISHVASESRSLKAKYLQALLVGYRVGVAKGYSSKYYCSLQSVRRSPRRGARQRPQRGHEGWPQRRPRVSYRHPGAEEEISA